MARFRIAESPFDIAPLRAQLLDERAGAYASFEGWVRNHHAGRAVGGLRYEAYRELAQREGERIVDEARARFAITDARCVHRVGELAPGELAVWVGVGAVGTVILGIVLFDEPLNLLRGVSVLLIVAGLVGLKLATP